MLTQRPFASTDALLKRRPRASGRSWTKADYPRGVLAPPARSARTSRSCARRFAATAALVAAEQAGVRRRRRRDARRAARRQRRATARASATSSSSAPPARARPRCWRCCGRASPTTRTRELAIAAGEQAKITRLRLEKLGVMSRITTHVLDTALGRPARGLARAPRRARRASGWRARSSPSASPTTDGRVADLVPPAAPLGARTLPPDVRDRRLLRGRRARRRSTRTSRSSFTVVDAGRAPPHPAAAVSPFGYSTYRGS